MAEGVFEMCRRIRGGVLLVLAGCFLLAANASAQIEISSIQELQQIGRHSDYPCDGDYVLVCDIDASATATWNGGAGFEPIGYMRANFSGLFDGQGHVIRGLVIRRPRQIGLFCVIDATGEVRNLSLEGGEIVPGDTLISGAIASMNDGYVHNCHTAMQIRNEISVCVGGLLGLNTGRISTCTATGPIQTPYYSTAGGLVGRNSGVLTNCCATGAINGRGGKYGGLVGENTGTVTRCYAMGTVSAGDGSVGGGLIGWTEGSNIDQNGISSCYAAGAVIGGSSTLVGGLVGYGADTGIANCYSLGIVVGEIAGGLIGSGDECLISKSYSVGTVTGLNPFGAGGLAAGISPMPRSSFWNTKTSGQPTSAGGTGLDTAMMQYRLTYEDAGWDFASVWAMADSGYPYLRALGPTPGTQRLLVDSVETIDGPTVFSPGFYTIQDVHLAEPVSSLNEIPPSGGWTADIENGRVFLDLYYHGDSVFTGIPNSVISWTNNEVHQDQWFPQACGHFLDLFWTADTCYTLITITALYTTEGIYQPLPPAEWYLSRLNFKLEDAVSENEGKPVPLPAEIHSIEELQKIGHDPDYPLGGAYVMMNDIDASVTATWNDGTGFDPIGGTANSVPGRAFHGKFDGNGHAITGLAIRRGGWVGLFAYVDLGGTVTRLALHGGMVHGTSSSGYPVGALVGYLGVGTISECFSDTSVQGEGGSYVGGLAGMLNGGNITRCVAVATVRGGNMTGGLVGGSFGTISQCYATGNVMDGNYAGGLAGWSGVEIRDCYAAGAVSGNYVAGGLVGNAHGVIIDCYSVAQVGNAATTGGLTGSAFEGTVASFWDMEASGQTESASGTGLDTEMMQQQGTYTATDWDFEQTWAMEPNGYPYLRSLGPTIAHPETEGESEGEITEGEGESFTEGETAVEGESPEDREGEVLPEGEGESVAEGESIEGEGEAMIEGESPEDREGEVLPEGEGESVAEGESIEGEGETVTGGTKFLGCRANKSPGDNSLGDIGFVAGILLLLAVPKRSAPSLQRKRRDARHL